MTKYSLSKSERIKSRKVVETLFSKGDSLFVHPLKLIYTTVPKTMAEKSVLFGATVPKRIYKTAVARNRIKRLIREAYRVTKPDGLQISEESEHAYALMFIYVSKKECSQEELRSAMKRVLKKLTKEVN